MFFVFVSFRFVRAFSGTARIVRFSTNVCGYISHWVRLIRFVDYEISQ